MSKKEILLLSAAIGFIIIWVLDLRAGTPPEIDTFWTRIFYHYSWLMMAVGCLFYFQYVKQIRLKKEEESNQEKNTKAAQDTKKLQRKALTKGKK
ncbi:hypothetical protein [Flectobacillus major]|uniref:hypothetical protein n=1 Tax=Flectobacillus major TaxID=103 RepID=UPI0005C68B8A|nr:hypothetical protein [Flectobacillus major]